MTTKTSFPASWLGTNRITQPPARSYRVPGGPSRENLGEVEVKKLADTERGGDDDAGYGSRR